MSSMLEQAIVDAQALREAALKNAEQTLIEKFAPQIKDAVESLLEAEMAETKRRVSYEGLNYNLLEINEDQATIQRENQKAFIVEASELGEELDEELLQEEELGQEEPAEKLSNVIDAPSAATPDDGEPVEMTIDVEKKIFEIDLDSIKNELGDDSDPVAQETPAEVTDDLGLDDLDLGALQESKEVDDDELVNEIMNLMNEMYDDESEILEEELIVDMGAGKDGTFRTDNATLEYYKEMQNAKDTAEGLALEKEKENENLKETLKRFKLKNKQYKDAVEKLSDKLNETLLSNAKLIYSNKTLGDASLNERQKNKIVEAIAKARTPEEARNLHEALNATVTSGQDNKSPRTLSESVTRKSTLSGILPRRKQQVNESEEHTFAEQMKKLAGIK